MSQKMDPLSVFQSSFVATSLKLLGFEPETVYFYFAGDAGLCTVDYFFCINGQLIRKHKVAALLEDPDIKPVFPRSLGRIFNRC